VCSWLYIHVTVNGSTMLKTPVLLRSPMDGWQLASYVKSRDSSVGIATDYGLDDRVIGVRIPEGMGIFLFTTVSRPDLGPTQSPIQWETWVLSLGVKQPVREAVPPPLQYVCKAWCLSYLCLASVFISRPPPPTEILVKHRDSFTFTFTPMSLGIASGSWKHSNGQPVISSTSESKAIETTTGLQNYSIQILQY
jgi:hypothetical protein